MCQRAPPFKDNYRSLGVFSTNGKNFREHLSRVNTFISLKEKYKKKASFMLKCWDICTLPIVVREPISDHKELGKIKISQNFHSSQVSFTYLSFEEKRSSFPIRHFLWKSDIIPIIGSFSKFVSLYWKHRMIAYFWSVPYSRIETKGATDV